MKDIYTNVNILEKIIGRRRLTLSELLQGFNPESEDFYRRGLGQVTDDKQIQTFVSKWFQAKELDLADYFLQQALNRKQ